MQKDQSDLRGYLYYNSWGHVLVTGQVCMQPGSLRGQEGQETGCPQGQAFRKDIVIQMKRALSLSTYLFGPVILISSHLQLIRTQLR